MACFASTSELLASHFVAAVSNLGSMSGFSMELFFVRVLVTVATSLLTHLLTTLRALVEKALTIVLEGSALGHPEGEGAL